MSRDPISYTVVVGEGIVTVTRRGRRDPLVANILGSELLAGGRVSYWLDRLVHPGGDVDLNDDWRARGAISSILTGPAPPLP